MLFSEYITNFEKVERYQINNNFNFKHKYNWYGYLSKNQSGSFCFVDTMRLARLPINYNSSVYIDINDIALQQEFSGELRFRRQTISVSNLLPILVQFGDIKYKYCLDKIISKVRFFPLDFRFDSGDIKCNIYFKNTLLQTIVHYERSPSVFIDNINVLFENYGNLLCIKDKSLLLNISFIRERLHRFMKKELHSTILYFHFIQLQHEASLAEIKEVITCLKTDIFAICKYLKDEILHMIADNTAYKLYCLLIRINEELTIDILYCEIQNDLIHLAKYNHQLFYKKMMYCIKLYIPIDYSVYIIFCKWINRHKFNALWYNEVIHNIASIIKFNEIQCVDGYDYLHISKYKISKNHAYEMIQCEIQKTECLKISCTKICKYLHKTLINFIKFSTSNKNQIMIVFNDLRSEILLSFPRSKKILLPMIQETILNIESEYLEKYFGNTKQIDAKNIYILENIYFIHIYGNDCTPILNIGLDKILDNMDTTNIMQWDLDNEFLRRIIKSKCE